MAWLDDAELALLGVVGTALGAVTERGSRNPDQLVRLPFAWTESPRMESERLRLRQVRAVATFTVLAVLLPEADAAVRHDNMLAAAETARLAIEANPTLTATVDDSLASVIDTAEFPDDQRGYLLIEVTAERIL